MNLKEFCKQHDIDLNEVKFKESEKNTYSDSNVKIVTVYLPKSIEGDKEGKDFLVCSKGLATKAATSKTAITRDSKVSYDEDFGYGLICAPGGKDIEVEW